MIYLAKYLKLAIVHISLVKLFDFVMMCYSYLDNFVLFQGERFWQKKKNISCVCGEGCAIAWLNKVLGRF